MLRVRFPSFLKKEHAVGADLEAALQLALEAWSVGRMATGENGAKEIPERSAIKKHRKEQLTSAGIEAAVLERDSKSAIRYRTLNDEEVQGAIKD